MQSCVDRRRINEKCRSDDWGVVGVRVSIEKGAVSNAKKAFETAPSGADIAALAEREGFVLDFCPTFRILSFVMSGKNLRSPFTKQLTGLFCSLRSNPSLSAV